MPSDARLLIFDLDGTLIDSRADLATAVNLMRGHFGLPPLPVAAITRFVGDGVRMLVARALEGTAVDVDEAVRVQNPLYRAHLHDATVLYPGVAEGLRALRAAGHTLAVATNKPADATELILDHFGVRALFASVLGGGSTPRLKPHPDMVEAAMAASGFDRDRTWVIGDNHTDLECARRAGVRSLFCTYGFGDRREEAPAATAASFDDIVRKFADTPHCR